jgi:hypothetical protein
MYVMASAFGFAPYGPPVVETHSYRASFHAATTDDKHRMHALLLGVGDLGLERPGTEIRTHAHHVRAEFVRYGFGVIDLSCDLPAGSPPASVGTGAADCALCCTCTGMRLSFSNIRPRRRNGHQS